MASRCFCWRSCSLSVENRRVPTEGVCDIGCVAVEHVAAEEESTSELPFVCLSAFALTLLLIILLMKISFINISAVVEVKVGVVGLF